MPRRALFNSKINQSNYTRSNSPIIEFQYSEFELPTTKMYYVDINIFGLNTTCTLK